MGNFEIIVIGGSFGGIQASLDILKHISPDFKIPIILVLHRLKGSLSSLATVFQKEVRLKTKEIDEKEVIRNNTLYIAPAGYHTLIEKNHTFSLDVSEPVNYSRPSIDVTFESTAEAFGEKTIGIILSGNNKDGSYGLYKIFKKGGLALVQDPDEAEATPMPISAIKKVTLAKKLKLAEISILLQSIK